MDYRYLRKISTLFFLFVFLSTKVSGLHILNHGDDHEDLAHCILCDHATAFNGTPVLLASVQELEVKVVPVFVDKEITSLYDVPFFSTNFLTSYLRGLLHNSYTRYHTFLFYIGLNTTR